MDAKVSAPNRIRDLRTARGWRQQQLADRSGLSVAALREIERGRAQPTPEKRAALASALCVPVGEAFPEEERANDGPTVGPTSG